MGGGAERPGTLHFSTPAQQQGAGASLCIPGAKHKDSACPGSAGSLQPGMQVCVWEPSLPRDRELQLKTRPPK